MGAVTRRSALLVFPALSLAFSASCADAVTVAPTASVASVPASVTVAATAAKGAAVPSATALSLLSTIKVARETPAGYARTKFRHWTDADGDGCNTREEVLIAESSTNAQVSYPGCKVLEGDWVSAYDGIATNDPSGFDIDHFVPLKEAWDSGAGAWSSAKREQFANDLSDARALVAVTASSNRSKGEKDPPQWMPPNAAVFCSYLSDWVAVKARWRLSMDQSEFGYIQKRLKGQCAGTETAAWGSGTGTPASSPGATTGTTTVTSAPSATSATSAPTDTAKGSLPTVHPGSWCTPKGAQGTYGGRIYVCSTTKTTGQPYSDGKARWRAA